MNPAELGPSACDGGPGAGPANIRPTRRVVAVIGAGIAGLAAALRCSADPDLDVRVLDAAGRTGGKLALGSVAGVQVDVGAEALIARRPEAVGLARRVGLADQLTHPAAVGAGLWARGALRRFPRPMVSGVPGSLRDLARTGILGPAELARAAAEPGLAAHPVVGDVSVGWFVRERLGAAVVDRLVEPLLGGVYAGRANELSWRACLPQLVAALDGGSLVHATARAAATATAATAATGLVGPVFAGLTGGVAQLATAVLAAAQANGVAVTTSCTVRQLARTPTGWRLVYGPTRAPRTFDADAVLLACPAAASARLLAPMAAYAAADLAGIDYASMAIVTLAVRREQPLPGSGFLAGAGALTAVKGATFSTTKWPWLAAAAGPGLAIVRASIGRRGDETLLQRDDAELVQLAITDLDRVLASSGQRLGAVVDSSVTRWGGGLPQYTVGHLDRVARIHGQLSRLPGLAVAGAAYGGVGVPACIASADRAVRALSQCPTDATSN